MRCVNVYGTKIYDIFASDGKKAANRVPINKNTRRSREPYGKFWTADHRRKRFTPTTET